MANQLATQPPNLQTIRKRYGGTFPNAEIYKIIDGRKTLRAHGTSDMPVWGDVYAAVVKGMAGGDKDPGQVRVEQSINGRILSLIYYLQSIQEP